MSSSFETVLRRLLFILALAAPLMVLSADKPTESQSDDPIIGRWKYTSNDTIVVLSANGKAHEFKVNFSMNGTWTCVDDKETMRKYRIDWEKGLHVYNWHLSQDGNTTYAKNGKTVGHRVKE